MDFYLPRFALGSAPVGRGSAADGTKLCNDDLEIRMSKVPPIRWLAILLLTVTAILVATSFGDIRLHLIIAGLSALIFIAMAIKENVGLTAAGASRHEIGAADARNMGLVWVWGAAILGISYAMLLTPWREWLHFFAAFAVVGCLCLVFAGALERDAQSENADQTLLKLGRLLTIGQCVGMIATIVGIAIDPDKSIVSKARPDWAANIVFIFGGLALFAISAFALWQQRSDTSSN